MTLLHLQVLLQKPYARVLHFLLIIAVINLNSCTTYKAAEMDLAQLKSTSQVTDNLDVYKFYVHDTYNTYQLINPVFNDDGSLSGELQAASYHAPDSTWDKKERKAYWKEHKYDINIFTETVLSVLTADLAATNPGSSQNVTITASMIKEMTITSIDMERQSSDAAVVVLGILGLIVVAVLVILLLGTVDDGGGEGSGSGSGSGSD